MHDGRAALGAAVARYHSHGGSASTKGSPAAPDVRARAHGRGKQITMTNDEHERRRAFEVAKTLERAYRERFYPVEALGSRQPEPVTPEVLVEFERLKGVTEAARVAWETSLRR